MHPQIEERVKRYERLYQSGQPGDVLIVLRQDPYWIKRKNLFDYDFDNGGHLEMAEDMALSAGDILAGSLKTDDDMIPWVCPDFGIAIHHTYLFDLPVGFSEWTSWAPHPMEGEDGWSKLDEVRYDPSNRWVVRIKEMLRALRQRDEQPYLLNTHYHFSALDLANALRGNDLFTDYYEYPDELTELLKRCTQVIGDFEEDLRAERGDTPGIAFWGALAPPGIFISEDAMDMSGPVLGGQWALPYERMLKERFGSISVHHHMLGAKGQGVISQAVDHSLIQIADDPNCPHAADSLLDLYEASGSNVLMFDCGLEKLKTLKDVLKQIRAVVVVPVGTNEEAGREAVDLVRSISNIQP